MAAVKQFQIDIGYDAETGTYTADMLSVLENAGQRVEGENVRGVLSVVSKSIRKRAVLNRKFPPPEKSAIIHPNGSGAPSLIIPARN